MCSFFLLTNDLFGAHHKKRFFISTTASMYWIHQLQKSMCAKVHKTHLHCEMNAKQRANEMKMQKHIYVYVSNKRHRDFAANRYALNMNSYAEVLLLEKWICSCLHETLRGILSVLELRSDLWLQHATYAQSNEWISLICCTNNCFDYSRYFFSLVQFTSHFVKELADDAIQYYQYYCKGACI